MKIRKSTNEHGVELIVHPVSTHPTIKVHASILYHADKTTTIKISIEEAYRWMSVADSVILTNAIQAIRVRADKEAALLRAEGDGTGETIDVLDTNLKEIKPGRVKVPVKKVKRKR